MATPEAQRAWLERLILLLACGVACPVCLFRAGFHVEALALVGLCAASQLARPPSSWVSRTCLDSGLLYGTALVSMALGSNLLNQSADAAIERHARLIFWCSVGCGLSACLESDRTAGLFASSVRSLGCASVVTLLAVPRERSGQRAFVYTNLVVFEFGSQLLRRALVKSFTVGEALVVVQCVTIATTDFMALTASRVVPGSTPYYAEHRTPDQVALEGGLLGVVWLAVVLGPFFAQHVKMENETIGVDPRQPGPRPRADSALLRWDTLSPRASLVFVATCAAWLSFVALWVALLLPDQVNPIEFVRRFTFGSWAHVAMVSYWFAALACGLPMIHWLAKRAQLSLIVIRKLYHLLALVMFAPAVALTPQFVSLSFGVSTALLLFLEYVRACRMPPLGEWLHGFMRSYTDSRDEGVAILTHLYLLVGCALPVWICPAGEASLAPFAGVLILGAGDAAGAIVGSTYGRARWIGGRKTFVGTTAAVVCTMASAMVITRLWLPWPQSARELQFTFVATLATCLLEAFTTQIDNLVLPLFFVSVLRMSSSVPF